MCTLKLFLIPLGRLAISQDVEKLYKKPLLQGTVHLVHQVPS
jgi:hypothetical protein